MNISREVWKGVSRMLFRVRGLDGILTLVWTAQGAVN